MSTDEGKNVTGGDGSGHDEIQVKKEESADQPDYCYFCEKEPCAVVELNEMLNAIIMANRDSKTNKQIRFCMYTNSVRYIYGPLGKGVRKQLPRCVQKQIHSLAPDKEYTGFVPSQEETE